AAGRGLSAPPGRNAAVQPLPILTVLVATIVGWGLVTNAAAGWLDWQGYLLEPVGLGAKEGAWAFATLGVLVALVGSFLAQLLLGWGRVRRQEALDYPTDEHLVN